MKHFNKIKLVAVAMLALFSVNKSLAQWCNPSYTFSCTSADYIQSFSTTGGLTNVSYLNSGCSNSSTNIMVVPQTLTVNPGGVVGFTLLNCPGWGEYYSIWLDANNDGDFGDPGEMLYGITYLSAGTSVTSTITIPPGAVPGTTRLRVMCVFGTTTYTACQANLSFGEVEDYTCVITSPCPKPTSAPATLINSVSAQINWNALAGSLKYDYIVDSTMPGAAILSTAGSVLPPATSAFVTGLKPNAQHYARVRSYCTATGFSLWDTMAFFTLPACEVPSGFLASGIDSNSANFQWTSKPNANQYQYVVDRIRTAPSSATGSISTTNAYVALPDTLQASTWYYVHIRSKCTQNDSSGWSLDSFRTPMPCRKPLLDMSYISANNAVVNWPAVISATHYEYYFGSLTTLPSSGTPVYIRTVQTPYLLPNSSYTLSVRSMCTDFGNKTNLVTNPPLSVNNVAAGRPIAVYPNPVKDVLTVELGANIQGNAHVVITDVAGKVVRSLDVTQTKFDINMSNLANGIYQLKYSDAGHVEVLKLNKQ